MTPPPLTRAPNLTRLSPLTRPPPLPPDPSSPEALSSPTPLLAPPQASVVGTPHSPRRSAKAGRKAKKSHAHPDLDGERFLNVRKGRRSAEDLELAQNVLGDSEEESDGSEAESDGSGEESASDASVSKRDGHVEVGGRRLQMND